MHYAGIEHQTRDSCKHALKSTAPRWHYRTWKPMNYMPAFGPVACLCPNLETAINCCHDASFLLHTHHPTGTPGKYTTIFSASADDNPSSPVPTVNGVGMMTPTTVKDDQPPSSSTTTNQ